MDTFLSKLADYILDNFGNRTSELIVVFPNKRAGLFLKHELAGKIKKTIWLPQITTIERFITSWSGISIADPLKLHFDLIEIHLELGLNAELDVLDFSNRATQFLRDFDEIDHYLVDAEKLFLHLNDAKAIELWHPDGSQLSEYERNYLSFYDSIIHYYNALRTKLESSKSAYPGMLFRKIAETDPAELLTKFSGQFVLFAGFNALTPAEERMISIFIDNGLAEVLWDLDKYYYEKNQFGEHEAGLFARRYHLKNEVPDPKWVNNQLLQSKKEVIITAVPGNISQTKAFANDFLQAIKNNPEAIKNSALILADESLLTPLINSIPDEAGRFNVTMGLPFQYSPVYQVIQALFDFQIPYSSPGAAVKLHAKKLLLLLSHNLWGSVLEPDEAMQLTRLNNWLIDQGKLFIDKDELMNFVGQDSDIATLLHTITQTWSNKITDAFIGLNSLIQFLAEKLLGSQGNQANFLLLNHLSAAGRIVNKLKSVLADKDQLIDLKSLRKLFTQIAPSVNISLYGEPLEGLQVMGLLESRNLSFRKVYLLSANEGILPGEKSIQSLVPFDIKRHYNMPTHIEKQAIYAYNFFRLIQSASTIHLYYNSEPDLLGGGEKSRYLLQLEHELIKLNPKLIVSQQTFNLPLLKSKIAGNISIRKDQNLMKLLEKKAITGFSPTSLSNYISCPLRFYLKDLLNIESPDELEESIGSDVLGTVVHDCLQSLYAPYKHQLLTKSIMKKIKSQAEVELFKAFNKAYEHGELEYGKNRLIVEVAKTLVNRYLDFEIEQLIPEEIKVIDLESKLKHELSLHDGKVMIKGTADRIDLRNNRIHIIDYKTGLVDKKKELQCDTWEDLAENSDKSKALQLMVYSYLYAKNNPGINDDQIISVIISLRKLSEGMLTAQYPASGFSIEKAENTILHILNQIFDQDQYIIQTTNAKTCRYCDFKDLCNRKDDSFDY
jgi:ATP-dependent helicase/nuclease subunit B